MDRVEKVLVSERLGEELHRAVLHRPHAHRDVAVTGDEHDGDVQVGLRHPPLEIEPAETGQADVEHEAAGHLRSIAAQELLGEANAATRSPTERIRFSSERRIAASSSTTKTIASPPVTTRAPRLRAT